MKPQYNHGHQVALVTGAGKGMGPATATAFALAAGAVVTLAEVHDGACFVVGVALPVDGGWTVQ
jgi:alanine dehydrogenase